MTLLQSCLIDVLESEEGIFPYYDLFLSRYSLITVTAIVSQLSLIPETYKGMTKADIDNDVEGMIANLPAGATKKRDMYHVFCLGAHIEPSVSIQESEKRTFVSELFTEDAKKYSLSNREMILRGLNSSSFLSYFFLFEDSLKNIYIQLCNPSNKFIKGSETIEICLENIISEMGMGELFSNELYERSKFFFDLKSLKLLWSLLNSIRNQIAHTNGFYDEKAKRSFNQKLELLARHFNGKEDLLLSITMILDVFNAHEKQINETGYLIVGDSLENIIRNISIFIMESLHVCKREEIANNTLERNS